MTMLIKEEFLKMSKWSQTLTLLTAADDNLIVTSANMKVGTYTIDAQPSAPSLIGVKVTASGTADTMGTITYVGTDIDDRALTETVTPIAGSTVWTTNYFKTISTITGAGWVIDVGAGNDTLIIGVPMSCGLKVNGRNITVVDVSGNIWVNPTTTATEANGFPLTTGQSLSVVVADTLSVIADSSGATFKYIIWE
jgi:hypothetical protein